MEKHSKAYLKKREKMRKHNEKLKKAIKDPAKPRGTIKYPKKK